jgi:cytidylate kinase
MSTTTNSLKYRNITISGGAATGKGTLKENLRPYLAPLGWRFRSGGDLLREFTNESKLPLASLAEPSFHKEIDQKTSELLDVGNIVVESWLAGFIAKERADTFRIFLYCGDDKMRVDRVLFRDKTDVETARKIIFDRELDNFSQWKKIYGDYDFWNKNIFHIMIDTCNSDAKKTLGIVLNEIGYTL